MSHLVSCSFNMRLLCVIMHLILSAKCGVKFKNTEHGNYGYDYWCVGNCDNNINTTTHSGIILIGGAVDVETDSLNDAFLKQIEWSGCGDFLVLRASGEPYYMEYIYHLGCSNSVTEIRLNNIADANNPFVIDQINNAEAIFFAGGNQATYVTEWMGSALQSAVQSAVNRDVPIGGTSAGAMIQSWFIYSAEGSRGVDSYEALQNPFNQYITFSEHLITQKYNSLVGTIIDTHFEERDRMGRLFTFVARLRNSYGLNMNGIGINEATAIVIDSVTMIGTVVGNSSTYVVIPGLNNEPSVCEPNTPLMML
eukprot:473658_1